jgi:hypothetical protein
MRRQKFLEAFLGALGAKKIIWTDKTENTISGVVIYDQSNPTECQDFIWHMTEENSPDDQVIRLLTYLSESGLLDGDKLKAAPNEIHLDDIDNKTLDSLFDQLFNVSVNMVDEGEETDIYFIHD